MMVLRCIVFTAMFGWLLGCSSGQRLVQVIVDKNQESAEHREENEAERKEEIRNTVSRHERVGATPEETRRAMLQEWMDHQQSAWVPVAVLSTVITQWPSGVPVERIVVNQRELHIGAGTSAAIQQIGVALQEAIWLQNMVLSDSVLKAEIRAVARELAPQADSAVIAELQRLSDTHVLGSSPPVADRNRERAHLQEQDALNCWERVDGQQERYRRLDGTWSDGGPEKVRPETPTVRMGQWSDASGSELGQAWQRTRAVLQLEGPFVSILQGLDCARSTGARYSVQSIEFTPKAKNSTEVVLRLEVALIGERGWVEDAVAPWGERASWGESPRPERSRVLENQSVRDPFSG